MLFPFTNTAIPVARIAIHSPAHKASRACPLHHQAASSDFEGTVFHWFQRLNIAFAVQYWLSFSVHGDKQNCYL